MKHICTFICAAEKGIVQLHNKRMGTRWWGVATLFTCWLFF